MVQGSPEPLSVNSSEPVHIHRSPTGPGPEVAPRIKPPLHLLALQLHNLWYNVLSWLQCFYYSLSNPTAGPRARTRLGERSMSPTRLMYIGCCVWLLFSIYLTQREWLDSNGLGIERGRNFVKERLEERRCGIGWEVEL